MFFPEKQNLLLLGLILRGMLCQGRSASCTVTYPGLAPHYEHGSLADSSITTTMVLTGVAVPVLDLGCCQVPQRVRAEERRANNVVLILAYRMTKESRRTIYLILRISFYLNPEVFPYGPWTSVQAHKHKCCQSNGAE